MDNKRFSFVGGVFVAFRGYSRALLAWIEVSHLIVVASVLTCCTVLAAQQNPEVGGAAMYSNKTIIQNAVNSPIHKTLVAAVKAGGLVDTLSGPGPFTVFAPTDDAFSKLPEGTVDNLVKPENKDGLVRLLQSHVVSGKFSTRTLERDIRSSGGKFDLHTLGGRTLVASLDAGKVVLTDESGRSATITIADVLQSNGIVQVIDSVLWAESATGWKSSGDSKPKSIEASYQVVRVFFATDRKLGKYSGNVQTFKGDRSPSDQISLGVAQVSIPRDHKMGELESPSLLRVEWREDPEKHVVLLSAKIFSKDDFNGALAAAIAVDPRKSALVFVHGYNVTFEDAARRLGQLTYDLGFAGVPILYSWPSKGTLLGYPSDEASSEWSTPHFIAFLRSLQSGAQVRTLYIVGHSMGNRLVADALANFASVPKESRPPIQEVVMAAPDIDAGVFDHLADVALTSAARITIYESSNDLALQMSHKFHDFSRLGDTDPSVHVLNRYDCIEASALKMDFLGHSYVGDNDSVIGDIFQLLTRGLDPSQRFRLSPRVLNGASYWAFRQ